MHATYTFRMIYLLTISTRIGTGNGNGQKQNGQAHVAGSNARFVCNHACFTCLRLNYECLCEFDRSNKNDNVVG